MCIFASYFTFLMYKIPIFSNNKHLVEQSYSNKNVLKILKCITFLNTCNKIIIIKYDILNVFIIVPKNEVL